MELSDENERKFNSIIKPKKLENEKFWEMLLNSKNLILGMLDQDSNHELNTFDDFIKIEEEIYTELPNEGKNIEEILETIKLKIVPGFNYENNNFSSFHFKIKGIDKFQTFQTLSVCTSSWSSIILSIQCSCDQGCIKASRFLFKDPFSSLSLVYFLISKSLQRFEAEDSEDFWEKFSNKIQKI